MSVRSPSCLNRSRHCCFFLLPGWFPEAIRNCLPDHCISCAQRCLKMHPLIPSWHRVHCCSQACHGYPALFLYQFWMLELMRYCPLSHQWCFPSPPRHTNVLDRTLYASSPATQPEVTIFLLFLTNAYEGIYCIQSAGQDLLFFYFSNELSGSCLTWSHSNPPISVTTVLLPSGILARYMEISYKRQLHFFVQF